MTTSSQQIADFLPAPPVAPPLAPVVVRAPALARLDAWRMRTWLVPLCALAALALEGLGGWLGTWDDDGVNLLKALMSARGHALYREIYSDQAPTLTWLLALVIRVFGPQYEVVRQLSIGFGVLTLAAVAAIAAELAGPLAGLISGLVLLLFLPFLKFGASIVVTIPAMGLAMWSMVMALRFGELRRRWTWLGSGALLGLAATIKLAALYFAPIVALALLWLPGGLRPRRLLLLAGWLGAALVPILLVTAALPVRTALRQLVGPHVAAYALFKDQAAWARQVMLWAPGMRLLYGATIACLVFCLAVGVRRMAIVALWLALVASWVFTIRPFWSHHVPDLLFPMSVCFGVGVATALRTLRREGWRRRLALPASLLLPAAVGVGMAIHVRHYDHWRAWYDSASLQSLRRVSEVVIRESGTDDWIVVDRPLVAFLAGRRVPPELAMISRKRIAAGALGDRELVGALHRYTPRLVVLCTRRFEPFKEFGALMAASYWEAYRVDTSTDLGGGGESCRVYRSSGGAS